MGFELHMGAFGSGGEIPRKYTCSGADVSPGLSWSGVPEGAQALGLIMDDPDAPGGTWTHWVVWNIPATSTGLGEAVPRRSALEEGTMQGVNDFNRIGYGGPCPPPGRPHRYFFRLYALDAAVTVRAGAARSELERAMAGHVIGQAEYMGMFKR